MPIEIDPQVASLPLPSPNFPPQLWDVLRSREAVAAAKAFSDAELPAAAGLSGLLVECFPTQVTDPQFRMAAGFGLRRVMEEVGYQLEREDTQVSVPGIFSTGAVYVKKGFALRDRSVRLKRAHRDQWALDRVRR